MKHNKRSLSLLMLYVHISREKAEKQKNRELAKEGKAPVFMNKIERKNKELVDKFEELKSSGKIDSYLKKKAKKNESKDRRKLSKMKSSN